MRHLLKILFLLLILSFGIAFGLEKIMLPEPETGPLTLNFIQGYIFDPIKEEPNILENLKISTYDGKYGYYIIQFPGPIKKAWLKRIERAGGKFIDYINRFAYLVRLPNAKLEDVRELSEVRWLGLYQPAYKIFPYLEKTSGLKSLIVVFFYDCNGNEVLRKLQNLGATNIVTEFNWINKSVKIDIDGTKIDEIARIPEVYWIEYYFPITPDNVNVQWVNQKGYAGVADTSRPIWRKGIIGDGIIVSITDSPLWIGHNLFRDTLVSSPGPTHRKVVAYTGTMTSSSHGTHTTGTLCGDDSAVGGTSLNDGLAKHARVYFQNYGQFSGWDMNTWLIGPYNGVSGLMARNHSMSLSRKDSFSDYVWTDRSLDQFIWTHRDFMHCNSMGNYNLAPTMGHPPVAKNLISVGSCQNGTSCQILSTFTSIGPTNDGRRKPTIVSPGGSVYSAGTASASSYISSNGTSMATPNMTAATALIRQYFLEGWYPSGNKTPTDGFSPSAALMKSVAIVGADNSINYSVPSNYVGWGRLDLDSSLYFASDNKKLWIIDDTIGLNTNDSIIYQIQIDNPNQPFRVSLVWSDYPGTPYSFPILINNLDLTVISPTGTEYKGSVYSSGQSVTGGNYDTLNVEECTRINNPLVGLWKIKVKAKNIPFGPQPFALAATYGTSSLVNDVGVVAITAPPAILDSAQITVPACTVYNFGNFTENYSVRMKIGNLYNRTASVSAHAPGTHQYVIFPACTVYQRGTNIVSCSTELAGDVQTINDKQTGSVFVQVLDVGASAILSPPAIIDSGQTITPQAQVKNFGNVVVSNIPVRFSIGSWQDNMTISSLSPNESTVVTFANWTAIQRGSFTTKCSTRLTSDMQNGNNKIEGLVFVRVLDVATIEIIAPVDTVDSSQIIAPQATLKNYGNTNVTFDAVFEIDTYSNTKTITNLIPDAETIISFDPWTASARGNFTKKCSTRLTNDMINGNDWLTGNIFVRILDVATIRILAPYGTIDSANIITPACSIYNYSNLTLDYSVRIKIGDFYEDTTQVIDHIPGTALSVTFGDWLVQQVGTHIVSCSTELGSDINPMNDRLTESVTVTAPPPPSGWVVLAPIPPGLSGKRPKSGSSMTGLDGKIYFLKASNTQDFHVYTPDGGLGTWVDAEAIPIGTRETGDGKKPKKGAAIAAYEPGKCIYTLRGNNTIGFWQFQPDTNGGLGEWIKLQNIPVGTRKLKYGSGLVAVTKAGNDYLFAMKGSKTNEFYLYDITNNTWNQVSSPSIGASGKFGYKKGSCLCYDGNEYVYVLQGYYGSFFKYNIEGDSWIELRQYNYKIFRNRDGKKKKPKDGAGLTYHNNMVYMLKGGNTNEFWLYDILADTWIQLGPVDVWDIPFGPSRKKVKGGGALTQLDNYFYVSKGKNTDEFYCHIVPMSEITINPKPIPINEGVMGNKQQPGKYELTIVPNPAINITAIRYSLPKAELIKIKLYNVTGSLIKRYTSSTPIKEGVLSIDTKEIVSGVYILQFDSEYFKATRKLVIDK